MSDADQPMRIDRRAFVVGGAMMATAAGAATRIPQPNSPRIPKAKFEAMVPNVVGGWSFQQASGLVLPPDDALSDRLYDNLVTRIYTEPGGQVMMLLLAYNNFQNGVLQIHRPEVCYPAGGYTLSNTVASEVPIGARSPLPVNTFSANGSERDEQVLYWTRIGERFPVRWIEQRIAVLQSNLVQINPDGLLARVSMANDDMASSKPLMMKFIADLRTASPPALRRLLFGPLA